MPPPKRLKKCDTNCTGDGGNKKKPGRKRAKLEDDIHLSWPDINHTTVCGRLLVGGGTNWDVIGRKEAPKHLRDSGFLCTGRNLYVPHRTEHRVIFATSGSNACHSFVVTEDGKVLSWGRNEQGQLGHGDTIRRDTPTEVMALSGKRIVAGATGRGHTLFLSANGVVYACGDNRQGQLGIGDDLQLVVTPTKVASSKPIKKVACGAEFSMFVDANGNLYSCGSSQYGQLGHNNSGFRSLSSPKKVTVFVEQNRDGHIDQVTDVHIVDVACGTNHTLAHDQTNRLFSWGFAGYGRLGHSTTKDEFAPRMVKPFDGINRSVSGIWCGGTYSVALDTTGMLYFWGQQKANNEATMYPKNIQDLNGWNISSVGCCNKSILVAADQSIVSWGPSPTYGELCYGEENSAPKSSPTPRLAKPMAGVHVHQMSAGYGHILIIARDDTEDDVKRLEKLPSWP